MGAHRDKQPQSDFEKVMAPEAWRERLKIKLKVGAIHLAIIAGVFAAASAFSGAEAEQAPAAPPPAYVPR